MLQGALSKEEETMDELRWHDPFNFPTWVYHYRSPDPELDMMIRVTPWDFIPDEDEDNPWDNDTSWMEEEPGDDWREGGNWPDPDDW